MAKFHFRLDRLLQLRRRQRDQRRAELAESQRAEAVLRRQQAELAEEMDRVRRQRATPTGPVDVETLLDAARYEGVLHSRRQSLEGQASEAAAEVDRRRQALLHADQQVRMLEQLRDKQHARHQADERRREIRQGDELAAIPAAHADRQISFNCS